MIRSMTGFANLECSVAQGALSWRVRSVNHRHLELYFHLPDGWETLEAEANKRVRQKVNRGRLDLSLDFTATCSSNTGLLLDRGLLAQVLQLERQMVELAGNRHPMSMDALLTWPGMVRESQVREVASLDMESLFQTSLGLLDDTLTHLVQVREREGEGLAAILRELLNELEMLLDRASSQMPRIRDQFAQRFRDKVREFSEPNGEEARLSQELAFLLNRMDVSEERDRLLLHIQEFRDVLQDNTPAGRKLDFYCQELNREANTLCSKAQDGAISRLGVDMKVIIEKMREQVQNLE